jgi:hypothetical protein
VIGRLNWNREPGPYPPGDMRRRHGLDAVQRLVNREPEWRDLLWETFVRCYQINPRAVRQTVALLSIFLHLGPYARHIIGETEKAIAEIDAGEFTPPSLVPANRSTAPLALSA